MESRTACCASHRKKTNLRLLLNDYFLFLFDCHFRTFTVYTGTTARPAKKPFCKVFNWDLTECVAKITVQNFRQQCIQCIAMSLMQRTRNTVKNLIYKKTVLSQGKRDDAAFLFGLKFHYKFKSSQASKARLQSAKHTGAYLTQNDHLRSFKIRVLESVERQLGTK